MRTPFHMLSKTYFNMPLRYKFISPTIAVIFISFLGVGIYFIHDQRVKQETRLQEKAERLSYLLLSSNIESIWDVDLKTLERNCRAFFEDDEITRLVIIDTFYGDEKLINLSKEISGTHDITKTADFIKGDQKVAKLEVVFSNYYIEQYLAQLRNTLAFLSMLMFFLMAALINIVSRIALIPLKGLMEGVKHLTAGDLKFRIPLESQDEHGKLAVSFNTMAEELSQYHGHLQELVEQRTAELEMANDKLQQEIVERKKYEDALGRNEEKYRELVQNANSIILRWDTEGKITFFNEYAQTFFGFKEDEIIGKHVVGTIVPETESTGRDLRPLMDDICKHPQKYEYNVNENMRRDGSRVWVAWTNKILTDDIGNPIGTLSIGADITEHKKAEQELKRAKEAAETANASKSVFLANMSHELRTPLNAIIGFSELLTRDPSLSQGQLDDLETIVRSGEHLLSLINDVLEFSKIEAGRIDLNLEDFDLHRFLSGLKEMFHLRSQQKGLYLNCKLGNDLPQYIRADQSKLRQILINLLGNAVKYTETGGITIYITNRAPKAGKQSGMRFLRFEVTDSGIGISQEDQGEIFDAFFQANGQRSPHKGTGLGLPISQTFVDLMGGVLEVNSELGKGTCFAFDIPVELVDCADTESSQLTRRVIGLEDSQPAFRLLVAEDNENNRNLLVKLLQFVGFEVQEAVNGQDAIEAWEKWLPHLIWMDMRMPIVDGYQATTQIKNSPGKKDTVIIALTASAFEEDRLKMIECGCNDFVRKPFREYEIFEMIKKHLGVRYVYEEGEKGLKAAVPSEKMSNESLTTFINDLPEDIIVRLKEATELSDAVMIDQVIGEIRTDNEQLAGRLSELANDFAYDKILNLMEYTEIAEASGNARREKCQ